MSLEVALPVQLSWIMESQLQVKMLSSRVSCKDGDMEMPARPALHTHMNMVWNDYDDKCEHNMKIGTPGLFPEPPNVKMT